MKEKRFLMVSILLVVLFAHSHTQVRGQVAANSTAIGMNRIEGRVTDQSNVGVDSAFVELYDNYGSMVGRQRTSGGGRFTFRGMRSGNYVVTVKPFGTNLLEDSKEVEINNQFTRSDTVVVDFRLQPDKRFVNDKPSVLGTIFAQDVPPEAERLYKSGLDNMDSKPERALSDLQEAIKLFPKYFNALSALGKTYIILGKYDTGYPYLLRAIDVNTQCGDCYYSLALAFYKLNQLPAAKKAADASVVLQPLSPAARLLQGIIYRLNDELAAAEKALLTAKTLSKDPDPEVHWQLSLVYNRMKRNADAANELEEYLKTKPGMSKSEKESVRDLIAKLRKSN